MTQPDRLRALATVMGWEVTARDGLGNPIAFWNGESVRWLPVPQAKYVTEIWNPFENLADAMGLLEKASEKAGWYEIYKNGSTYCVDCPGPKMDGRGEEADLNLAIVWAVEGAYGLRASGQEGGG